ncbi:MAG: hypothetical protein LBP80_11760 [Treponema sp.]|nr:hypothetical protein [Treponema sp.]
MSGASPASGRITAEGTLSLPAGYYRITLELYHAKGFFSRSDIAHIYGGMTTETGEYSLTADDFIPETVEEGTSLADVLSAISGLKAGENTTCFLFAGEETMSPGRAANSEGPVTITIDGGGRIVTLENNVTLVLKNITLRGRDNNNAALVRVDTGGTLEAGSGILITANAASAGTVSFYGGGVYVNNGTFTKQPGAVIYGSDAGRILRNYAHGGGSGDAVNVSETKQRNTTAGAEVTLDNSIDGTAGGWEEPLQ